MSDELIHDHTAIVALTVRMGWFLDHCQWDALPDLFTEEVLVDYSSLNGGEPAPVQVKDLIERWRSNRAGLSATQHLVSNQIVSVSDDRSTATATAMFQATHVLPNPYGGPIWTLGGEYRYGLVQTAAGWRIGGLAMSIIWADGNRHIRDLAAERYREQS
jgi:hypothetical protein